MELPQSHLVASSVSERQIKERTIFVPQTHETKPEEKATRTERRLSKMSDATILQKLRKDTSVTYLSKHGFKIEAVTKGHQAITGTPKKPAVGKHASFVQPGESTQRTVNIHAVQDPASLHSTRDEIASRAVFVSQSPVSHPQVEDQSSLGARLEAAKPTEWCRTGDIIQLPWEPAARGLILLIELWPGLGCTLFALLSLGFRVVTLAYEASSEAKEVFLANFPQSICAPSIASISAEVLAPVVAKRDFIAILVSAGCNKQGLSTVPADPISPACHLQRLRRVAGEVTDVPVLTLFETDAKRTGKVDEITQALGVTPITVEAKEYGWVERSQSFWISSTAQKIEDTRIDMPQELVVKCNPPNLPRSIHYIGKKPIPERLMTEGPHQPLVDPTLVVKGDAPAMHSFMRERRRE